MEFQITLTDKLRNFTDYVDIKQTQANGVVLGEYKMALNDVINALSNASIEGRSHETPFLPKNCIKFITSDSGDDEVFIELPKRQWSISYMDKQMVIGFPRLILNYRVHQGEIRGLKIVAIKESDSINEETDIYYFPYSNVHHDSGDVCMGTNTFPKIDRLNQLEKMHFLFFSAPFGSDYGAMTLKGKTLEELFKEFHEKPFHDELLFPTKKSFNEYFFLGNK
ncbi:MULTISPECIES: hypothetical protein [Oceanobacillus]|uniref:PRTRC system protein B n=1 Tax=Oceanobacillus kimchii TaxID=746691 RepID=A0ABQ5TPH6_9BACI|nr:hypothetical protein [Oceanobacillus kimchii]GLO68296.1 hypothetical protein MACH08_40800 [Oceanobacillus kimchii]